MAFETTSEGGESFFGQTWKYNLWFVNISEEAFDTCLVYILRHDVGCSELSFRVTCWTCTHLLWNCRIYTMILKMKGGIGTKKYLWNNTLYEKLMHVCLHTYFMIYFHYFYCALSIHYIQLLAVVVVGFLCFCCSFYRGKYKNSYRYTFACLRRKIDQTGISHWTFII